MTYYENGDLSKHLKNEVFRKTNRNVIMRHMIKGVSSIHKKGQIHRDLNPNNMFLTKNGILKLGDFGLVVDLAGKTD